MFAQHLKKLALVLVAAAVMPATAAAQQGAMPTDPAVQEKVTGLFTELQQVRGQLEQLQMRALQDEQLSATQEQIGERIRIAMNEIDPTLDQTLERAQAIEGEARTAQQAGDNERLQQLGMEMQQIEMKFRTAQEKALQQGSLMSELEAFQSQVEAKMTELDPEAAAKISRLQEIELEIASVLQQEQQEQP